ncbi:MAG TPA: hypothetical protein VFL72_07260 [Acidimicrobiia bacterium]|nr:hypothetical protein [Acidimicrobiia bacterium]
MRLGAAVVLAVLMSACSNQVVIQEVLANGDGTTLNLGLASCGGTYEVDVVEAADSVQIRVQDQRSPISFGGDDCSDVWTVDLAEPLGGRDLIDASNGEPLAVSYEPWNQVLYSEDEFRTALEKVVACILEVEPELEASVVDGANGPELRVEPYDLPDGESRMDPTFECWQQHVEPLRH